MNFSNRCTCGATTATVYDGRVHCLYCDASWPVGGRAVEEDAANEPVAVWIPRQDLVYWSKVLPATFERKYTDAEATCRSRATRLLDAIKNALK